MSPPAANDNAPPPRTALLIGEVAGDGEVRLYARPPVILAPHDRRDA